MERARGERASQLLQIYFPWLCISFSSLNDKVRRLSTKIERKYFKILDRHQRRFAR